MVAQDSFISDEEEDLCPLCIEEMDISDRNFRPCPCGYQICQFCYNNIRQDPELNGKCPACRRTYDDSSVEYKQVSSEELRRDQLRQNRKEKERKQREREKKEPEQPGVKKHLSGMRVIQKNLVYVIGLNPNIPTDDLHETLRGEQFFGQYGKIQKIVINKRINAAGNPGIGVYVTFARKDDAARCIAAVDGSINDGKYLRAAYGTTKYCSSYLRGQPCPNPNCMFLHEPGEEADSYTRRDLSAMQHRHNHGSSTVGPISSVHDHTNGGKGPVYAAATGNVNASASANTHVIANSNANGSTVTNGNGSRTASNPSSAGVNPPRSPAPVTAAPLPASSAWGKPVVRPKAPVSAAAGPISAVQGQAQRQVHAENSPVASARAQVRVQAQAEAQAPVAAASQAAAYSALGLTLDSARSSVAAFHKSLETLPKGSVGFVFSSNLLSEDDLRASHIPYFSISLSDEGRRSAYDEFSREFPTLSPQATPTSFGGSPNSNRRSIPTFTTERERSASPAAVLGLTGSPFSARTVATPPPGLAGAPSTSRNSHELLTHLMKGKPANSQSVY